jgi:putative ABC transport system ATP-binding protein
VITLRNVARIYRTTTIETTALRDFSLDVPKGQFIAVMAPSGSGKSTFLNIVGMLDSPSAGEYSFDGQNIVGYSQSQLAQLRKHAIGFIFLRFNLIDELNVLGNVELALLYHGEVSARERRKRANKAFDRMKMTHRKHHMPSQLSRVAAAARRHRAGCGRAPEADPS